MSFPQVPAIACVLLFVLLFVSARAAPPLVPSEGVLVLHNGNILRGKVTRVGDHFVVALSGGSQVRLVASEVDFWARSLEQAYRQKQSSLREGNIDQNLQLARWCMRHRLFAQAAEQIVRIRSQDPNSQDADRLERQLYLTARSLQPRGKKENETRSGAAKETVLQHDLPREAMSSFTSTIQPILLNGCSATTCHGGRSAAQFQIFRSPRDGVITRPMTQRNLAATLRYVDFDQPETSPLLTVPKKPHGGTATAVFLNEEDRTFRALDEWIRKVASNPVARPKVIQPPATSLLQTTSQSLNPKQEGLVPEVVQDSAALDPLGQQVPSKGTGAIRDGQRATVKPYVPKDPFDPEIFNRRYNLQVIPTREQSENGL